MTAPAELLPALQPRFTSVTARPTGDHPAFNVAPSELTGLLKHLRDEHGFDFLVDVTAIDWAEGAVPRFEVVHHLLSSARGAYVRVVAACADAAAPSVPSAAGLWPAADWHERETYDMFGIRFEGHPDLRRILMWDEFPHHPLRKEFPLAGVETEYPAKDVVEATGLSVKAAPMMGGPFVAAPGRPMSDAEPRAKDESWTEKREKPEGA